MDTGERGGFTMGLMEFLERRDVNVADAIAVGQAENAVRIPDNAGRARAARRSWPFRRYPPA